MIDAFAVATAGDTASFADAGVTDIKREKLVRLAIRLVIERPNRKEDELQADTERDLGHAVRRSGSVRTSLSLCSYTRILRVNKLGMPRISRTNPCVWPDKSCERLFSAPSISVTACKMATRTVLTPPHNQTPCVSSPSQLGPQSERRQSARKRGLRVLVHQSLCRHS